MLVRFLDKQENCFEIDNLKTPILIFANSEAELNKLKSMKLGECLVTIPSKFDDTQATRCNEKLNTKNEPRQLK